MSSFAVKLLGILVILNIAHSEDTAFQYSQRECFKTVTHYYSNPAVVGTSLLYHAYKNDDPKTIDFNISCPTSVTGLLNRFIHLESIKLSIPSAGEDICPDSKVTSFATCKQSTQCDCCEYPNRICAVETDITKDNRVMCDGRHNCVLQVTSEFLKDCSVEDHQSHSRWAEIFFSCKLKDVITEEDDVTVHPSQTTQNGTQNNVHWLWLLLPGIITLVVISLIVYGKRRYKNYRPRKPDEEALHHLLNAIIPIKKFDGIRRRRGQHTNDPSKSWPSHEDSKRRENDKQQKAGDLSKSLPSDEDLKRTKIDKKPNKEAPLEKRD